MYYLKYVNVKTYSLKMSHVILIKFGRLMNSNVCNYDFTSNNCYYSLCHSKNINCRIKNLLLL